ncbi:hypothetical protein OHA25_51675 [Nonomuraea sp. NBC_00507]|uniref:hypothetical protein n=1 Tax=Nonomuraea sp. NBC_00507 TaxID=2976002 RepID=UPI002E17383A
MSHSRWKSLRERKLADGFTEPEDVTEARREIRLSMALDATLNIALDNDDTQVSFTGHRTNAA